MPWNIVKKWWLNMTRRDAIKEAAPKPRDPSAPKQPRNPANQPKDDTKIGPG